MELFSFRKSIDFDLFVKEGVPPFKSKFIDTEVVSNLKLQKDYFYYTGLRFWSFDQLFIDRK